ncbi:MAG: molybdate ABC transporter substrate-binding protein [Pseudobacteriovorax sp.]|nr:molybdate ABC transporter substrate-binding protein [Pseudobacteriovorax sp.]
MLKLFAIILFVGFPLSVVGQGRASNHETLRIAVAANFYSTAKEIAEAFSQKHGIKVELVNGSSGKIYHQLLRKAPIDIFISANHRYTDELYRSHLSGQPFALSLGRLAVWRGPSYEGEWSEPVRKELFEESHVAIANPKVAPFGQAAQRFLSDMGWHPTAKRKLLTGESVAQAFHFARSSRKVLGVVAYSQILSLPESSRGTYWLLPEPYNSELVQTIAPLKSCTEKAVCRALVEHFRSEASSAVMERQGYRKVAGLSTN